MTAGYSGTPLSRKLGIVEGMNVLVVDAPTAYTTLVTELPAGVRFASRAGRTVDLTHVFSTRRDALEQRLARLRSALRDDAMVWVSWPKKASKVATDITEDVIREVALPLGFVDVKVCAVSDIWSGLKLVVRKELRG